MKKIIIILIILTIPHLAFADIATKKLKLGYIEFPPYTYTNSSGKPDGILIDLASKVFKEAGYEWDAVSYPVKRLAEYLVCGDLDIWMGLKTLPVFKDTTYIGNVIIAELTLNAYTTGNNNPPVTKKEDLSGKSLIIMRGYSYGGWINYIMDKKNKISYIKSNKHSSALKILKAKRADYLLDYNEPIDMALEKISIHDLKYNQISSLPCYFIVTKKLFDGVDIINKLETVFVQKKKTGQL